MKLVKTALKAAGLGIVGLVALVFIMNAVLTARMSPAERAAFQAELERKAAARDEARKKELAELPERIRREHAEKAAHAEVNAFYMARDFVRGQLKAPATATFPGRDEARVENLGDGRYKVFSYVDSQNGFGAMVRTRWACELMTRDGERFSLVSVKKL